MEASVGTVLVAVVAVVVVCCLLLFRRRGGSKKSRFQGDTIVFLGNTGAGKSVLFSQLFRGKVPETVNSIEEEHLENARLISREEQREARTAAAAAATAKDQTPFHAVCLPGNRRLRSMYHKHLPRAAGIVLVVDASDPDIKGTAAFLHELLVDKVVDKQCPPILLACTKNDVAKRRKEDFPAYFINSLEAELDILKKSQNSVAAEGTSSEDIITLGVKGQKFKFEEDSPSVVTCALCSVAPNRSEVDVAAVEDFIESCFPTPKR
eukprot:INCI6931.1.p1 GENE.INCI6931.1~~INCI6931.1.p1  ORF type:complete len:265 (+),score=60.13 INCI6931.1:306-1100(+)